MDHMAETLNSESYPAEGELATSTVVICGAGPAGLTAALELTKHRRACRVLEQDPHYVGGIARTVEYRGYRFDIGGHRFFSKNEEVEDLWTEILGTEMLTLNRLSRIFYKGRFYDYPIRPANALHNLGLREAYLCGLSYLGAKLRPHPRPQSFEGWVTNQFGARLFRIFFKTYTEKVWGMSTADLSADWAAQRIKGLSLWTVFTSAIPWHRTPQSRGEITKTLIDHFRYPRLGPGQCWEMAAQSLARRGLPVAMGERVVSIRHGDGSAVAVVTDLPEGDQRVWPTEAVISSLPLRELVEILDPPPPPAVQAAGRALRYRDFLTVALIVSRGELFRDNWIYIHDPTVKVGRIQNFKNWSPDMVPNQECTCVGMEYFCFQGDGLWSLSDQALIALAASELAHLGFCGVSEVVDGMVVRQAKAYPVYDSEYQDHVLTIRTWLEATIPNLWCVGRNGMHKYNNQDHSMMTALIAARRILGLTTKDPWRVNADAEYHEESGGREDRAGRQMPLPVPWPTVSHRP